MFRNFLRIFLILIFIQCSVYAAPIEAGVTKTGVGSMNSVIDTRTNEPVPNAKVSLPKQNYSTYTDDSGKFDLNANITGDSVLSVEKEGYRPFSVTINERMASKPIIVAVEKSNVEDIILESDLVHLGDDNFSENSANCTEFKTKSIGPFYSKSFKMTADCLSKTNYLFLGTIIGIDTFMARSLGQNKVVNSYASPPEVYFNGNKVAEIQLNGDGQRIKLPNNLIRPDNLNEITIKTGKNLMQTAYVDYDDIEVMNLSIISE